MSMFTKTFAIAFTVLALGASAQAQSNGGGRGGGSASGGGGEGETAIMAASPNGLVTHVRAPERRRVRAVRVIPMQPCADGNAAMNKHVCNPMTY